MDISPSWLVKFLLPRTPLLLKTALFNILYLSENSNKQDVRTELTVTALRSLLSKPASISKVQAFGLRDPGVKGPRWVSKVTASVDGTANVREALVRAIKELGDDDETYRPPEVENVEAEWTGYRSGVDQTASLPDISEEEKYKSLMHEVKSDVTILYFHGGALCVMDPISHRTTTSHLAKLTGGRCLSVRYRLAPQNPFPAALLDALVAYLYLQSPPPGALHEPVTPSNIVFAGDSAGGNLSLALLQTILTLRRVGVHTIPFHGQEVPLEVPAGLALNSPWCDVTMTMPSVHNNAHFDYLSPPSSTGIFASHPSDTAWPTSPPRLAMYCDASVLSHPLVSPLAASPDLWSGSPPTFMCLGSEGLEDEISITARRMREAGTTVLFEGYEGMPHCFCMVFPASVPGKQCFQSWSRFCTMAVRKEVPAMGKGAWMKALSNPPSFDEVDFSQLSAISDEVVDRMLREAKTRCVNQERSLQENWNQQQKKSRL